ncbi:phosphotransferase family protein [Rhizorhabdus argentea]|uniref:phosphotransferase family protein n=1 Tax=Rhizorhabdus argentea TaxID=1387174 RepID=UPI0030EC0C6F
MAPKDRALLLSVRRAIVDLASAVSQEEHKAVLRTVDVSLNELVLRQDDSFYLRYYRDGVALIRDGVALGLGEASLVDKLPELDSSVSNQILGKHTEEVTGILTSFLEMVSSPDQASMAAYFKRVMDWELSLYRHWTGVSELRPSSGVSSGLTRDTLQSYLRQRFPDEPSLEVTNFTRLFGGFSKLTVMFSTNVTLLGGNEFVIRAEQASIIAHPGGSSENEYAVMRYAYEQGVRIPEPLWVELDSAKLGARFVVSRRAKGAVFGTTVGASAQLDEAVLQDLARELVKIHTIAIDRNNPLVRTSHLADWAALPTLRDTVLYKLEYWKEILESSPHSPSPMIARCFNWLAANVPECDDDLSLIHGDYGLHNILIDDSRVTAVLDWEVTHLGDRAQDVIWLIICLTGAASYEEVLEFYYRAGGKPISKDRLDFYDVYMSFNLLIVCNIALARLDQTSENPALAEIGLRVIHTFAQRVKAQIG